jgi:hypothetical protein
MLLLGLLLVGATAAFTGLVVADNNSGSPDYAVSVLGHHIATMNTLAAFLAGAALALVFCLGLAMMSGGSRRAWRRRTDLRTARAQVRDAEAERDMLASRVPQDGPAMDGPVADEPMADRWPADDMPATKESRGPRHRQRHLFGH